MNGLARPRTEPGEALSGLLTDGASPLRLVFLCSYGDPQQVQARISRRAFDFEELGDVAKAMP